MQGPAIVSCGSRGLGLSAEADLEAIGDYIARDNPRRAVSFVTELQMRCHRTSESPASYPRREEPEAVRIERVLHGPRLLKNRL